MITLRRQEMSDAQRFFEILHEHNFEFFNTVVNSVEEQEAFLRKNDEKIKNNTEHNFAILLDEELIGGCSIKIRKHKAFIGEIGYFLEEKHWGKGYTTKAVKELERIGFEELGLHRIEICMNPNNLASEKVAIKTGYEKEGLMKGSYFNRRIQEYESHLLYAKTKKAYLASQAASSLSKS